MAPAPAHPVAVTLRRGAAADVLAELAAAAEEARGDTKLGLEVGRRWATRLPRPGRGGTPLLWESLATLGAVDLTVARAAEPHLDALAILDEAALLPPADATCGVWAAEGPGVRLGASETPGGWTLSGTKPWCSLADSLTHALVTAWVDADRRQLFLVDLDQPGVRILDTPWVARGLFAVRSPSVELDRAVARRVGGPEWYLRRDGFAWGGMGVAAVWYGATVAIARRLWLQAAERDLDQVGRMHLGVVDTALTAATAVLVAAADDVDAGRADGDDGALAALRVRQVVADAAETVLRTADHALGPGPLTTEEEHAARVDDLRLYVRQHHGERDAATLGGIVSKAPPW